MHRTSGVYSIGPKHDDSPLPLENMRLPNWAKILWWTVLFAALTTYLGERYADLRAGRSNPVDVVVFLIWIGLLLAPLFDEVTLFGLTLKRKIEEARRDILDQVQSIKAEIQNTIQISPNISFPLAPADSQLPAIEQNIRRILEQQLRQYGIAQQPQTTLREDRKVVSEDVLFLFEARYLIERDLRRIARAALDMDVRAPISRLTDALTRAEILSPELSQAIRQVYAVCSPAVHGEEVSETKVRFVRDVAPELLTTLTRMRETAELQIGDLKPKG
jgi:hypothetical protein